MGGNADRRYISMYERCDLRGGGGILSVEPFRANGGFWLKTLALTVAFLLCAGCERVGKGAGNGRIDSPARPTFSEQLVCVVSASEFRWQHMYRLDMNRNQAEFVGGFGQRIASLRSQSMTVSPDVVTATFPGSEQGASSGFEVSIQRDDLSYQIALATSDDGTPPRIEGRCSILDGGGFSNVRSKGVQWRQMLKNQDKTMAVATAL
jgi:hypothetical protein